MLTENISKDHLIARLRYVYGLYGMRDVSVIFDVVKEELSHYLALHILFTYTVMSISPILNTLRCEIAFLCSYLIHEKIHHLTKLKTSITVSKRT